MVSDLSGQSNIRYKAKELGIDLSDNKELSKKLVNYIKILEYGGFQFDGAEASFELLLSSEMNEFSPFLQCNRFKSKCNVMMIKGIQKSEAVLKVEVDGEIEHTASDGDGPVNALDNALRKASVKILSGNIPYKIS